MEDGDDTIWIRITQTSPTDVWTYSYGLLTWQTALGKELGTIKVYGDVASQVFALGVGLSPSLRDGMFVFTPRAYNRRWISIDNPPVWNLDFEAQSGISTSGPGTGLETGTLVTFVDVATGGGLELMNVVFPAP